MPPCLCFEVHYLVGFNDRSVKVILTVEYHIIQVEGKVTCVFPVTALSS